MSLYSFQNSGELPDLGEELKDDYSMYMEIVDEVFLVSSPPCFYIYLLCSKRLNALLKYSH